MRAQHPSLPASYIGQPSQRDLLAELHAQIRAVTVATVAVDADAERFPDNWLFKFRWGKGKKKGKEVLFVLVRLTSSHFVPLRVFRSQVFQSLTLLIREQPDGSTSSISHLTVGGRTSAIVDKVQKLPEDLDAFLATPKRSRIAAGLDGDKAVDAQQLVSGPDPTAPGSPRKKRKPGPVVSLSRFHEFRFPAY